MTYLPVVPNLSPALAQAIGLFEVDGMTILLQVENGWLIARQDHISRLRRYRWATTREDVSLRRVLEREKVKRAGPETWLYQTGGRGTAVILRRTQLQGLQTCLINEQYSQNCWCRDYVEDDHLYGKMVSWPLHNPIPRNDVFGKVGSWEVGKLGWKWPFWRWW